MNQNSKIHLPFLDGIRGIAILAVFLYHCIGASIGYSNTHLPWNGLFRSFEVSSTRLVLFPFSYGFAGVAVFFVVSGFCIHLSHQRSKERSWLSFANKRFFRIYPPYLLAICFFSFVWPWGSIATVGVRQAAQLLTHLLAIHNLDERTFFGINGSFWSIAVELQLYVIYPLLLLFQRQFGWTRTLIVVGLMEFIIRLVGSLGGFVSEYRLPYSIVFSPFAFWFSWSIGAYLCECFINCKSSRLFKVRCDLVAIVAFSLPLFRPTEPFTFLAFALLTAVVIERLITEKWKLPVSSLFRLLWSHLSFLGVVSYSFYLFHQPIIGLTERALNKLLPETSVHPLFKYVVCLSWYPSILLFSYLLYRSIEKPSILFGNFVWRKVKEKPNKTVVDNRLPAPCRDDPPNYNP